MLALLAWTLSLPPQAPPLPQSPPVPQSPVVVEVTPYSQLLARVRAGERVLVASGVPAPAGFESIEIPGEVGLFECFLQDDKPMMKPITRPMTTAFVPTINGIVCRT